jgi:NAD(P)-dependent dehydrogenase (short-subunit alcohol dehydrogenase family)/aryl carrier-like protein
VITVESGSQFHKIGERAFAVNPKSEADYHKLMQHLRESDQIPNMILHCWSLTNESHFSSSNNSFALYQESGFVSLLFLAKSIGDSLPDTSIDIKVICNYVQEVTGEEELIPEKATLIGPCRVIPQEYDNLRCSCIDISYPFVQEQQKKVLLDMLLAELTGDNPAAAVAYRGKHRWVQYYEPISLKLVSDILPQLRKDGVYLIAGGLGGIGLVLAEFLAQTTSPNLVLVGRTPIPDRKQWDQWLQTHNDMNNTSRKIRKIMDIEATGARVLTISADVADPKQMAAAKTQIDDQFGRIHGVIHAAGVAGAGMIQLKTTEAAQKVLAPKVKGALNLEQLLGGVSLDFFVLCSSVSSIRGGIGQVDYCAANAFLDAFAHKYALKHHAISINWGMWQQVGMGVNTDVPHDLKPERDERLELGILPEEGKKAFACVLGHSLSQVIISSQDFFDVTSDRRAVLVSDVEDKHVKLVEPEPAQIHARPNLSSAYVVPGNPTEQKIAEIWQQLLNIETIGVHDNFFELGGHSILGTKLIERMRATFGIKFPLSTLFEKPTVHALSQMILEEGTDAPSFVQSKNRGQKRRERRLNR